MFATFASYQRRTVLLTNPRVWERINELGAAKAADAVTAANLKEAAKLVRQVRADDKAMTAAQLRQAQAIAAELKADAALAKHVKTDRKKEQMKEQVTLKKELAEERKKLAAQKKVQKKKAPEKKNEKK